MYHQGRCLRRPNTVLQSYVNAHLLWGRIPISWVSGYWSSTTICIRRLLSNTLVLWYCKLSGLVCELQVGPRRSSCPSNLAAALSARLSIDSSGTPSVWVSFLGSLTCSSPFGSANVYWPFVLGAFTQPSSSSYCNVTVDVRAWSWVN